MEMPGAIFAYFGPETVLPLTSVVAAVVGVVLMFGRNTVRFIASWLRFRAPGPTGAKSPRKPHFAPRDRSPSRSHSSRQDPTA
jgi:hypothetical protein